MRVRSGSVGIINVLEDKPVFGQSKTKIPAGKSFPILCRHCDEPKCVEACLSGALAKEDDRAVRHDNKGCVKCWMCIMTCPYGAILIDPKDRIILKCDLCPDREIPACVEACKTGALTLQLDKEMVNRDKTEAVMEESD
jgi:carbon-monoxide dehydrogenase iron sulfur subunit